LYRRKKDWRKNTKTYSVAKNRGLLDECTKHMKVLWEKKWSKDKCLENALNYETKKDWRENSCGAYSAAKRNKWIDECCQHMK